jgi:hypothetical protein
MRCFQLVKTVLDEIYCRVPGATEDEKDALIRRTISDLSTKYAKISKENSIDHSNMAARFAYIYMYVTSHANIVYQIISKHPELGNLFDKDRVRITCLGGGPGSDFLGVLKYILKTEKRPILKCILYDKENAWGECWNDVDDKLDADVQMRTFCQNVDVTNAATWSNYDKYLASDLFTMIYFLSEVYSLREQAEAFFLNVFEKAERGSMFLFVDNSSPVFCNWFDEMVARFSIDVIQSKALKMNINDLSEEKTDLGEYWNKFHSPKLTADIAYRICKKRL